MLATEATAADFKVYGLEVDLYHRVRPRLEGLGCCVLKVHGDRLQERAVDLIICYRGRYIGVELKRNEHEKATDHQNLFLERIRKAGGIGLVAWTVAQCLDPIRQIDSELDG